MRWLNIYPPDARSAWIKTQLLGVAQGGVVLDAGCGWQIYKPFCAHLEYRAQDFGKYDGLGDGRNVQTSEFFYGKLDYVGNIWSIDEKDGVFGIRLASELEEPNAPGTKTQPHGVQT